jgi:hypothetical protein
MYDDGESVALNIVTSSIVDDSLSRPIWFAHGTFLVSRLLVLEVGRV